MILERHGIDAEEASWEVGRLVLAPQYRAGPELLKRCLFLTLLHLVKTVEIDHIFATCTPLLGRLYRRFGFNVAIKDVSSDRGEAYSLIYGVVPRVLLALACGPEETQIAQGELTRLAVLRRESPYEAAAQPV